MLDVVVFHDGIGICVAVLGWFLANEPVNSLHEGKLLSILFKLYKLNHQHTMNFATLCSSSRIAL
jgi:hypothetical protein